MDDDQLKAPSCDVESYRTKMLDNILKLKPNLTVSKGKEFSSSIDVNETISIDIKLVDGTINIPQR